MTPEELHRRLERERNARQEAERLLEVKAGELYLANRELQAASEELRNSGLRLQAILDAVALSLITIDDDGHILSLNAGTQRMFGHDPAELLGTSVWALLPRVMAAQGGEQDPAVLRSENLPELAGIPAEFALRKDGSVFPADFTISDTVVDDERIIVVAIRDISQRVEREQAHRALEGQLHQAQKLESLGTLAGGIAHEINTPTQYIGDNLRFLNESFGDLGGVLDAYAALKSGLDAGSDDMSAGLAALEAAIEAADLGYLMEEMPNAISQSLEGVKQVASIVQAMKEFSHPGTKSMAEVDLNRAIENALAVSRNSWKHVARLETDLDPDLGLVPCLAAELNQVLLNLVVNAAQAIESVVPEGHAGDGRELGLLRVSSRRDGEMAEIRVADSGDGIPAEIQGRIFDPFFTTKEVGKGTGQGLSISHDIVVQKHGGTLTFETVQGEGSCFIVRLPLEAGEGCATDDGNDLEAVA